MNFNFHKVSKYCYFPGIQDFAGFFELIVNNQKWETLPPDLKEIVGGVSDAAMIRAFAQWPGRCQSHENAERGREGAGDEILQRDPAEILDRFVARYDAVQTDVSEGLELPERNL